MNCEICDTELLYSLDVAYSAKYDKERGVLVVDKDSFVSGIPYLAYCEKCGLSFEDEDVPEEVKNAPVVI